MYTDGVTDLSIHPTGKYVATCSKDGTWAFHEVISKDDKTFEFQTHLHVKSDSGISALQFHPDGALVAIGLTNGRLDVYQIKTCSRKVLRNPRCPCIWTDLSPLFPSQKTDTILHVMIRIP